MIVTASIYGLAPYGFDFKTETDLVRDYVLLGKIMVQVIKVIAYICSGGNLSLHQFICSCAKTVCLLFV